MSDWCSELNDEVAAAERTVVAPSPGAETIQGVIERIQASINRQPRKDYAPEKAPWSPPPPGTNLGSTHDCKPVERVILDEIMRRRQGHGISVRDLAALAKVDERTARDCVEHLRQVHELAIAGNPSDPYFWPQTRGELKRTIASLRSRQNNIDKTIKGIIAGADRRFGRELLEEW